MIKVTAIFDNKIASPDSPFEFARKHLINYNPYYATLLSIKVEQGDWSTKEEEKNENNI
jgi:hypothetical protein